MSQPEQNRSNLESQVLQSAAQDPRFRQELLQNPRQALSARLGVNIPETIQFEVLEETPTTFYLVLPPAHAAPGQELSDADLGAVAGGWSEATICGALSCGHTCKLKSGC